jgi:UDP-N-acetylglucosamine 2-epimerase (non-hydrolysing)
MMVGLDFNLIQSGISILEGQGSKLGFQPEIVADYNVKNVSEKVLRVIISYTDYINRVIWKKSK